MVPEDRRRVSAPAKVDEEVAESAFAAHLEDFFKNGRGRRDGWERIDLDGLHAVIRIPAVQDSGELDHYFVKLGAEYYPVWPPTVAFVQLAGEDWVDAGEATRWWPKQNNSPGFPFGLHASYTYPDQTVRQLVCFSFTFEFYVSNHGPTEDEKWDQGRHTLTATLSRLGDVLRAPNYEGPAGDSDS
jgi:hypothetical protein